MSEMLLETAPNTQLKNGRPRLMPQGKWTYEDWLTFPDDGWKYEIIEGVLYMSPPPATNHQFSSISLAARMFIYADENDLGRVLEAPTGVKLPDHSVPVEPDIFFIRKDNLNIIKRNYVMGIPDLIVEILSPSNFNYDLETKFELYETTGVPEYWIVNYWEKTIEVYLLKVGVYEQVGAYEIEDTAKSVVVSGFEVKLRAIFAF